MYLPQGSQKISLFSDRGSENFHGPIEGFVYKISHRNAEAAWSHYNYKHFFSLTDRFTSSFKFDAIEKLISFKKL